MKNNKCTNGNFGTTSFFEQMYMAPSKHFMFTSVPFVWLRLVLIFFVWPFYFGNLRGPPPNAMFPQTNSRPYCTGFLTTIIIMHFNMELGGAGGVPIVLVDVDVVVFFEEPGIVLATVKALRSGSSSTSSSSKGSSSNMASMPRTGGEMATLEE